MNIIANFRFINSLRRGLPYRRLWVLMLLSCIFFIGHQRPARAAELQGDFTAHDPTIIKQENTYYVFSTGDGNINQGNIQIRASEDLINWRFIGTVFQQTPAFIAANLGSTPPNLWAPDIVYFNDKYYLYYSASFFGTNNSLVALATNRTLDPASPDYGWVDEGLVIRTTRNNNWNAIDPNIIFDTNQIPWLVLGSFFDGIKMRRIDAATGKLSAIDPALYSLAGRPTPTGGGAIEAPSIVYHEGYYYLFVSFDSCCRGANSDYKVAVGRSLNVTGPYADMQGRSMTQGGGTIILVGDQRFRGTGGQHIYLDGKTYRMVNHSYDAFNNGRVTLQTNLLNWTPDGWVTIRSARARSDSRRRRR